MFFQLFVASAVLLGASAIAPPLVDQRLPVQTNGSFASSMVQGDMEPCPPWPADQAGPSNGNTTLPKRYYGRYRSENHKFVCYLEAGLAFATQFKTDYRRPDNWSMNSLLIAQVRYKRVPNQDPQSKPGDFAGTYDYSLNLETRDNRVMTNIKTTDSISGIDWVHNPNKIPEWMSDAPLHTFDYKWLANAKNNVTIDSAVRIADAYVWNTKGRLANEDYRDNDVLRVELMQRRGDRQYDYDQPLFKFPATVYKRSVIGRKQSVQGAVYVGVRNGDVWFEKGAIFGSMEIL